MTSQQTDTMNTRPLPVPSLAPLPRAIRHLKRGFLLTLVVSFSRLAPADSVGTAFTYQGRLQDGTNAATGLYDLRFTVYDAVSGGNQLGPALTDRAVGITNGLFTVMLDFATNVFTGQALWLESAVRTNGGGAFALLPPREPLTAAPYALYAVQAAKASSVASSTISALNLNTPSGPTPGQVLGYGDDSLSWITWSNPPPWLLGGNAGTTPGAQFLGTTDNQPLEVKVNGLRALRLEPNPGDANSIGVVNVLGGSAGNSIAKGTIGSVIAGGGALLYQGLNYSNNVASDFCFLGGGGFNTISTNANCSVLGGGIGNSIRGGGIGAADNSSLGGGFGNTCSGLFSTVPGGYWNTAAGFCSFAAGRWATAAYEGDFVWSDSQGQEFSATMRDQFLIRAKGGVGIGMNNSQSALHVAGTVTADRFVGDGAGLSGVAASSINGLPPGALWQLGGNQVAPGQFLGSTNNQGLVLAVAGQPALTMGTNGSLTMGLCTNGAQAAVALGAYSTASGPYSFALGRNVLATNWGSLAVGDGTIAAGWCSLAGGDSSWAYGWDSFALGERSFAGGDFSVALGVGASATGQASFAQGIYAEADGLNALAIGNQVTAKSDNSVAIGALSDATANLAVALGYRAQALHWASFVWADYTPAKFESTANNQFLIRASGGVGIGTNNPQSALHVVGTVTADAFAGPLITSGDMAAARLNVGTNQVLSGMYATLAGGEANTNVADFAVLGGGEWNSIGTNADQSVLCGGEENTIAWAAGLCFLGGGQRNSLEPAAWHCALVGGGDNHIQHSVEYAILGGGMHNGIDPLADFGVLVGGQCNRITTNTIFAFIGGGTFNTNSGSGSALIGGAYNVIGTNALSVFLGGGNGNTVATNAIYASLCGGISNSASGAAAFIGGGGFDGVNPAGNTAGGAAAAIAGGTANTASGSRSTVAGGHNNSATNWYATVPGGAWNTAGGQSSFAAGQAARALNDGCFVWNCDWMNALSTTAANQFLARANGGFSFYTSTSGGATLAAGSGSWTSMSDRHAKENIAPVDSQTVLVKVAELPLSTWNYKAQDPAIRHLGPMAQDFKAAFGLGETDTGIASVDADGVALAAIQGLNMKLEAQQEQLRAKDARIQTLEQRIEKLELLLTKVTEP